MRLYPLFGATIAGLFALVLGATAGFAQTTVDVEQALAERAVGAEDAPVTIIEYFSLTCPHCAEFHTETFPALKEKYIDTGKVRFVFRDFPLDRVALPAAVMARCVDPKRYTGVISVLFESQVQWAGAQNPLEPLSQIGRLAGLSEDQFHDCIASEAMINGVLTSRQEASRAGVSSTPSFLVNGKLYPGGRSIEEFSEIIDPLLEEAD